MAIENLTPKQEKEIKKEVKKQTKEIKKEAKEEIKKKLHQRIINRTKKNAGKFKDEAKKHTATAITAAFGFLIALSWRTPIQNSVNKLIEYFGLAESAIYYEYISAVIITIIAVLALMLIASWTSDPKK